MQSCDLSCWKITDLRVWGVCFASQTPQALKLAYTWAVPCPLVVCYFCVCVHGKRWVLEGRSPTRRTGRRRRWQRVSLAAGPLASGYSTSTLRPPALLTDALMKDKTKLDGKTQADTLTHPLVRVLERERREKDSVAQKRSLYSMWLKGLRRMVTICAWTADSDVMRPLWGCCLWPLAPHSPTWP